MLNNDIVFKNCNLGAIRALADHHDPVHTLSASEELGLGYCASSTTSFSSIAATLTLSLQAGGTPHFLGLTRVR